jgi:hypothetical protein
MKSSCRWTVAAVVVLFVASLTVGCQSCKPLAEPGTLSGTRLITDPKDASRLEKSLTDTDIAALLDVDVQAKLPTSLAIARLASPCPWCPAGLAPIDGAELQQWQKTLAGQQHIRGLQPISELATGTGTPNLHDLRVAAAKMNCELLLVYLQADSSVDNYNNASVAYWTILGLWVSPGNTLEQKTTAQAVLVDCRTGMLLGTATGSCRLSRSYPAAFHDSLEVELAKSTAAKAMTDLQTSGGAMIARVVDRAVESAERKGR